MALYVVVVLCVAVVDVDTSIPKACVCVDSETVEGEDEVEVGREGRRRPRPDDEFIVVAVMLVFATPVELVVESTSIVGKRKEVWFAYEDEPEARWWRAGGRKTSFDG